MKKSFRRVLPFFVIFALLFAALAPFVFALEAPKKNDYSRPGYSAETYNEVFDAAKFLREKLNVVNIGSVEEEYLNATSSFYLSYPKNIPSSYVKLYPTQDKTYVSAKTYSYTNSERASVSWIPSRVTLGGASVSFRHVSDGDYEAIFDVPLADGLSFAVE